MGYNAAEGANPGRRRAAGRPGGGRGQLARDAAGLRARRHATKVIYIAVGNGEKYGGRRGTAATEHYAVAGSNSWLSRR